MKIEITKTLERRFVALAAKNHGQTAERIALKALRRGLKELEGKSFRRYPDCEPKEERTLCLTPADKEFIQQNPALSYSELSSKIYRPVSAVRHYRLLMAKQRIEKHLGTEKDLAVAVATGLEESTVRGLRLNLGYRHPLGGVKDRNRQSAVIAKLGGVDVIKFALTEEGETIASLCRNKGVIFSRERGRQILGSVGITGDADFRKPIWHSLRLFDESREDRRELAGNFADEAWLKRELANVGGVSALSRKYGVTYGGLKNYIGRYFPGISRKFTRSHGKMVKFKCGFCHSPVFVEKRLEKIRPHELHFCNAKDCRDNFMRQNGGLRSLRLK